MDIHTFYKDEELPDAVKDYLTGRAFYRIMMAQPWEDDDYSFVLVEFSGRLPRTFHVFEGACLRPLLVDYEGRSEKKAYEVFFKQLLAHV